MVTPNIRLLLTQIAVAIIALFATASTVHAQVFDERYTTLHTTEKTKVISVHDARKIYLSPEAGGYFVAITTSGEALIFDTEGNITGKISNCLHKDIVFEDSVHALVHIYNPSNPFLYDIGIINTKGEVEKIVVSEVSSSSERFIDGIGVYTKEDRKDLQLKEYYFDTSGKVVFSRKKPFNINTKVYGLCDGLRPMINEDYLFGFYDKSWKMVIPYEKRAVSGFSEGLAIIEKIEGSLRTYGYMDINGNFSIQPKFSNEPGLFHDGFALAKKTNGHYCFIDKTGKQCSPEYAQAEEFNNGVALVWPVEYAKYKSSKPAIIIDKEFKEIGESEFYGEKEHIRSCSAIKGYEKIYTNTGKRVVKVTEVIDLSPNGIISFKYGIGDPVKGYANMSNEVIVLFKEEEF